MYPLLDKPLYTIDSTVRLVAHPAGFCITLCIGMYAHTYVRLYIQHTYAVFYIGDIIIIHTNT